MTIEEEMALLPNLKHVGIALSEFACSLQKGRFTRKKAEWIYSYRLFGFRIQYKRVEKIYISLKEFPKDIEISEDEQRLLPLYQGRWDYTRIEITSPRQMACATRYMESSFRIWHRSVFRE